MRPGTGEGWLGGCSTDVPTAGPVLLNRSAVSQCMRQLAIPNSSSPGPTDADGARPRGRPGRKRLLALGLLPAFAVIAAACGSSGTTSSSSQTTSKPAATNAGTGTSAASTHPAVMTANNSKFGTILVSSAGMTLYTFTNGSSPASCTGTCLGVWPPLTVPAGVSTPTGGSGVTNLGTTMANGVTQVTEMGQPLYMFSLDKAPGDANGDGVNSFGGVWHVAKAASGAGGAGGSSAATMPSSPTTAPSTTTPSRGSGGNGYGY